VPLIRTERRHSTRAARRRRAWGARRHRVPPPGTPTTARPGSQPPSASGSLNVTRLRLTGVRMWRFRVECRCDELSADFDVTVALLVEMSTNKPVRPISSPPAGGL